jgi:hypothetical protein
MAAVTLEQVLAMSGEERLDHLLLMQARRAVFGPRETDVDELVMILTAVTLDGRIG